MNQNNQDKQPSDTLEAEKPEAASTGQPAVQQSGARGASRSDEKQPRDEIAKENENTGAAPGGSQPTPQPNKAAPQGMEQRRP